MEKNVIIPAWRADCYSILKYELRGRFPAFGEKKGNVCIFVVGQ